MSYLPELPYKMYTKSDAELLMRDYGNACARAAMEHAAQIIERMRDEHCRMTQMADDKRDHCFPGGGDGCEFVEAWNDAADAIRAEIEKEEAK